MSVVTSKNRHGLLPGDRIILSTDSNRMRRVIAGINKTESDTVFRTLLYTRPSRGFAKHIRKMKQGAR